ncbi:hypothetical protein Tco_0154338 [Tanacetum coccineum]
MGQESTKVPFVEPAHMVPSAMVSASENVGYHGTVSTKEIRGNAATKKTQRNILKQQYEIFTASSLEVLDQNLCFVGFKGYQSVSLTIHGEKFDKSTVECYNLSQKGNTCKVVPKGSRRTKKTGIRRTQEGLCQWRQLLLMLWCLVMVLVMIRVIKQKKVQLTLHSWLTLLQSLRQFIASKIEVSSLLEEFVNEPIVSEPTVKKHVVETSEAKASADKPKVVRKNFGPPLIEDWISDSKDEAESKPKIERKKRELLTLMGYEKLSQKLTFFKAFFSPQWKFLIHTVLQCLSPKTTAWNGYGAVNEEMDDGLVRAATTTSSLEAEQDSGVNTPRSDEDKLKLNELMEFCTKLQQRVLDLENTKTAQAQEITSLKLRCMTRSLYENELFNLYKEPEREFRSSRRHFKTLSLDELRSLNFNLLSDQEYSKEEEAEAMAETMEKYMSKTRTDYGSGVARPKIEEKDSFE